MQDIFESYRPLMFSIAYRMLGTVMDAEDIVQDAFLRYQAVPQPDIQSHKALLSTITVRLCIQRLNLARTKREEYIGPWLPEPLATDQTDFSLQPEKQADVQDSISMAFLVVLESLSPLERAVFLMRSVFEYSYGEIAEILERDETACRKLFSRAKQHIQEHRPRFESTPQQHAALLQQFGRAVEKGDVDGLVAMLADDVQFWADSGGKVRGAALHLLEGREGVIRFVTASLRFAPQEYRIVIQNVNGEPALMLVTGDRPFLVITVEAQNGRIRVIRVLANPDKLQNIHVAP